MISIIDGNILETDCKVIVFPIGENTEDSNIFSAPIKNDDYPIYPFYLFVLTKDNELDMLGFYKALVQLKRVLEDNYIYSIAISYDFTKDLDFESQESVFRIIEELFAGSLIHVKLYRSKEGTPDNE
jgi:hypothetical protein